MGTTMKLQFILLIVNFGISFMILLFLNSISRHYKGNEYNISKFSSDFSHMVYFMSFTRVYLSVFISKNLLFFAVLYFNTNTFFSGYERF